MEKEKILVMLPTTEEERQAFYRAAPDADVYCCLPEEATRDRIQWANVIFGSPAIDDVRGSQNLRWLQSNAAGPDSYLQPSVLPQGCQLTNASGSYGLAISEHMLGMLLMLLKKLHTYRDSQHRHEWKSQVRSRASGAPPCWYWDWEILAANLPAAARPWALTSSACAGRIRRSLTMWTSCT